MNIEKSFKLAKNASELSDYNKKNIHIGSVMIYKNKVIANGWNSCKTNPLQMKYNMYREMNTEGRRYDANKHLPFVHAEMKCLIDTKDLNIDWAKVHLFIYRESCGKGRMCRPCPSCMKALKDRGIKHIWYINNKGEEIYEEVE